MLVVLYGHGPNSFSFTQTVSQNTPSQTAQPFLRACPGCMCCCVWLWSGIHHELPKAGTGGLTGAFFPRQMVMKKNASSEIQSGTGSLPVDVRLSHTTWSHG